jgi:hypothetical protein
MQPYVVRQGDYLDRLAARFGFDAYDVWNHAKNKPLRDQGRLPEILHPTDILYIPAPKPKWLPVKIGVVNTFTAPAHQVTLALAFKTHDGKPLANAACVFRGLLPSKVAPPATTDGSGALQIDVSTRQGLFLAAFPLERFRFVVQIGHMDPLGESSGTRKRLENLGYGASPMLALGMSLGHHVPADDASAHLAAFQRQQGILPTGTADDVTLDALKSAHGV